MIIERVTEHNLLVFLPYLVETGLRFASAVPHGADVLPTKQELEQVAKVFVSDPAKVAFMAVEERLLPPWCDPMYSFNPPVPPSVAGVVVGALAPVWYNPSVLYAAELGWWMNEEHRGGSAALRLVRAFEGWAREQGALYVSLSAMRHGDTDVGRLCGIYEKMGYYEVERTFLKKI